MNDDGHLDTEDRHLIIKDGTQPNHAISLSQLQSHTENTIKPLINNTIRQCLVQLDSDIKGLLETIMRVKIKPLIRSKIKEALKKTYFCINNNYMTTVINFNHVSNTLTSDQIDELKSY